MNEVETSNEEYEFNSNPVLKEIVEPDSPLKEMIVNYIGEQHNNEDDNVTVEMVVITMLKEFPDFLLAIAEENFIRGYNQALVDVESMASQTRNTSAKTNCDDMANDDENCCEEPEQELENNATTES